MMNEERMLQEDATRLVARLHAEKSGDVMQMFKSLLGGIGTVIMMIDVEENKKLMLDLLDEASFFLRHDNIDVEEGL